MQPDVIAGDFVGIEDFAAFEPIGGVLKSFARKGAVDGAVDHDMGDVQTFRAQFAGKAFGDGAQARLGGGEGGKPGAAPKARRRARENEAPARAGP